MVGIYSRMIVFNHNEGKREKLLPEQNEVKAESLPSRKTSPAEFVSE